MKHFIVSMSDGEESINFPVSAESATEAKAEVAVALLQAGTLDGMKKGRIRCDGSKFFIKTDDDEEKEAEITNIKEVNMSGGVFSIEIEQ